MGQQISFCQLRLRSCQLAFMTVTYPRGFQPAYPPLLRLVSEVIGPTFSVFDFLILARSFCAESQLNDVRDSRLVTRDTWHIRGKKVNYNKTTTISEHDQATKNEGTATISRMTQILLGRAEVVAKYSIPNSSGQKVNLRRVCMNILPIQMKMHFIGKFRNQRTACPTVNRPTVTPWHHLCALFVVRIFKMLWCAGVCVAQSLILQSHKTI